MSMDAAKSNSNIKITSRNVSALNQWETNWICLLILSMNIQILLLYIDFGYSFLVYVSMILIDQLIHWTWLRNF